MKELINAETLIMRTEPMMIQSVRMSPCMFIAEATRYDVQNENVTMYFHCRGRNHYKVDRATKLPIPLEQSWAVRSGLSEAGRQTDKMLKNGQISTKHASSTPQIH